MPDLTLALPPPPAHRGLDPGLLTGQLAPASLVGYRRDVALYLRFCDDLQTALEATSLARWRTHLAQHTRLSPHTINRRLAAVKRLVQEAAALALDCVAVGIHGTRAAANAEYALAVERFDGGIACRHRVWCR